MFSWHLDVSLACSPVATTTTIHCYMDVCLTWVTLSTFSMVVIMIKGCRQTFPFWLGLWCIYEIFPWALCMLAMMFLCYLGEDASLSAVSLAILQFTENHVLCIVSVMVVMLYPSVFIITGFLGCLRWMQHPTIVFSSCPLHNVLEFSGACFYLFHCGFKAVHSASRSLQRKTWDVTLLHQFCFLVCVLSI